MAKFSTGLRNAMLDTGSLKAQMNLCFMEIYSGAVPADADASIGSAVLLCTVSNASTATGLTWDTAAAAGVLLKNTTEVWSGVNGAGGTASFYRLTLTGDTGGASTTEKRIQGTIGAASGDMIMSNPVLVNGATTTINYGNVTLPSL